LNGIMSSALSALEVNSSALNVVSSNIANINTPGYARRTINEQTQGAGGQLSGVSIADIQRVTDQYLTQQTLSATASSSQYGAQSNVLAQINALLGQVGSGTDLPSQLNKVLSALSSASLSPTSSSSQTNALSAFQTLASSISGLSNSLQGVQAQTDQQVVTDVASANSLIQQINTLNQQIQSSVASGGTSSGLMDQRDQAAQSLSKLMGINTSVQSNGQMLVSTKDGVNLIGNGTYAQLAYAGGSSNGSYGPITIQSVDTVTGANVGPPRPVNAHLGSGEIAGLIQSRDGTLAELQQQLGVFAQQTAQSFNAQYNANAAVPPPASLTGRDTGLLAGDALNFTGQSTFAVTNASGNLVSRIDVNFSAGTLTVDGGSPVSFGATVGGFTSALNTALGSNGQASFTNGVLSLSASSGNGIVVQDDASAPSSRGGTGISQFFGLNNLFQTGGNPIAATGLSFSDAAGFAAGGTIQFQLGGSNGTPAKQASVTLTAGMSIGDVVSALNTAFGSAASFSLASNGALSVSPGAGYAGAQLAVLSDSTQRGGTGMSLSTLFALGTQQTVSQAQGFSVNPAITSGGQALAFARPQLTASTIAGGTVVAASDNSGLQALQTTLSSQTGFPAAGGVPAQSATLGNYAAGFYQSVATQTQSVQASATAAGDQLTESQSRQSQVSGVNLDEELSNMVIYQQAYSAAARVMQSANQIFTTLMQVQT
jgi:flagellar hook-associated protein 1 FlgK